MEPLEIKDNLDLDNPDDVGWLYKLAKNQHEEIMKLKAMLWLKHGCGIGALYGDDGELQCGTCMIDFKRMTADEIQKRWDMLIEIRLKTDEELKAALKDLFTPPEKGS
jgi:hypothetical protein